MNNSLATPTRSTPSLTGVREFVDEYAQSHGVGVCLWVRSEDGWTLDTASPDSPAGLPGGFAVPFPLPGGGEACVEIIGVDGETGLRSGRFLAELLTRVAQYAAESRFFGRELAERYEEITLLYTISEVLGSVISLEEAAATILMEVSDTMGVERVALWVYNPTTELLDRVAAVGKDGEESSIRIDDDASMTAAVFRGRTSMMLEPGQIFPRDESYPGTSNRDFFLSVPVSYTPPRGETRTIGVINLIGRVVDESFSAGDQKLITAIASQIGAAIENSRLVAESLRQERLGREMELAHDLQLKLLPSTAQFRDFCDVAARCAPAESVGGDFYHLFRLPNGRIGVMIGDVSSHGFAAALIMALTMSAVAIHASEGDAPAEVLRRVHRALIEELESTEMYLTLFYGVIDPEAGQLTYANAGHPHAFRVSRDGETVRIPATNLPFGLVDLDSYAEESIPWIAGEDLLFLFTDGLSDSLSLGSGEEILVHRVAESRHRPLDELLDSLFELRKLDSHVPADDRSAVLLRV